jgi:hypothetical protein
MYNPGAGRFASRDPIGYRAGVNLYEYVGDLPGGRTDPFGLQSPEVPSGIGGAPLSAPAPENAAAASGVAACKCPPKKKECDAAITRVEKTISQMVTWASNGKNHTLSQALAAAKPWATATGFESQQLKRQPCFFQQAVRDVEASWVLDATSGFLWFEELVASSLPNWAVDNSGWNTGNGDAWMRMEMWRLQMLKSRIKVLCKGAK